MIYRILLLIIFTANVAANDYLPAKWWPSPWGADDQRGALNRLSPATTLAAAALITTGAVYDMGRVFEEDMPLFALTPKERKYTLTVPGAPSWGPLGENKLVWNEDHISGHLTQDGTQFDALSHMGTDLGRGGDLNEIRYYNGHSHAEIGSGRGFSKLGVEHVPPIFTRGVLFDIAALRGRTMNCSEEVSTADLKAALAKQGLADNAVQPGNALFYHTGWGRYWKIDNEKFNACTPGLSDAAGDWVVEQKVVLVGTDNWGVEAIPGPDPKLFGLNHQKFLVEHGIFIIENLSFDRLIEAGVYEFAFVVGTIPLKGATGSPVRPFAIK
jgi:kynurenine formamidase